MKTTIIIPSRLNSSRLPEKALIEIMDTSLIMRVYKQALKAKLADDVVVATDHQKIFDHVKSNGGKVMMTSENHISGTDRIAEVALSIKSDIIINVQGDEPLINPLQIDSLIALMKSEKVRIGTQCRKILIPEEVFDYNVVKVTRDINDKCLYFSRNAIPAMRDLGFEKWFSLATYYRHVGIYGFKYETLSELTKLSPSNYEKIESLEQLRWLEHGYDIYCQETSYDSIGVDVEADIEKVESYLVKENFH